MREKYESLSVATLRSLAKARNMRHISGLKKSELVEAMLAQDKLDAMAKEHKSQQEGIGEQEKTAGQGGAGEKEKAAGQEGAGEKEKAAGQEGAGEKEKAASREGTEESGRAAGRDVVPNRRQREDAPAGRRRRDEMQQPSYNRREAQNRRDPSQRFSVRDRQSGSRDYAGEARSFGRDQQRDGSGMTERQYTGERGGASERQYAGERGGVSERQYAGERGGASERQYVGERGGVSERQYAGERSGASERQYAGERSGASERQYAGERGGAPERQYAGERGEAPERQYAGERGGAAERYYGGDRTGSAERSYVADRGFTYDRSSEERAGSPERGTERAASRETGRETMREPSRESSREPSSDRPPMDLASLDSGRRVTGILEVLTDGYGFLRSDNYLPGENDVYVAPSQIRRFNLKTGDIVTGNTRVKAQQEKYSALLYIVSVNGCSPSEIAKRPNFEDMTPIFPDERLRLERGGRDMAMRIVDLLSPVGKGQRGMIVSPPKAGKTTLLKDVAKSILLNNPEMHILIMLIDERPEEVTDIREAIVGDNVEVLYSTFDELPEHHKRVSEMGIERAKRLVENGQDVTILLDSITRLARAYNLTVAPSGRTLSGGLDPAALNMPKRFFGAARNMREGGSLTILATALVDTGSKMDDVVYEEFKGTGNMELVLDRKLSERRVFPAIDIQKSGTRREDLLLDAAELEAVFIMRKALNGMRSDEAVENILNMFVHTKDNEELVARVRRQRFI